MKRTLMYTLSAAVFISALIACSKSDSVEGTPITVESLSGTYILKDLTWNYGGINFNIYDSLDACEKDNLIEFKTDKTVDYIDAGVTCTPPSDDSGTWDLQGDSLIFSDNYDNAKIESFNGKTLILSGTPEDPPGVIATTTLEKQ